MDGESPVLPAVGGYVAPATQPVNTRSVVEISAMTSTNGDAIRCIRVAPISIQVLTFRLWRFANIQAQQEPVDQRW